MMNTSSDSSGGRQTTPRNNDWTISEKESIQSFLAEKLSTKQLSARKGPCGNLLAYVPSHRVIELANLAFSFDGWSSSVQHIKIDHVRQRQKHMGWHQLFNELSNFGCSCSLSQESQRGEQYHVAASALVRVTLKNGCCHEDVGCGFACLKDVGKSVEQAKKVYGIWYLLPMDDTPSSCWLTDPGLLHAGRCI